MERPLESSYWTTVAIVVCALAPDIVATTAHFLLAPAQLSDRHTNTTSLTVAEGVSNAGYAFGALLAVTSSSASGSGRCSCSSSRCSSPGASSRRRAARCVS